MSSAALIAASFLGAMTDPLMLGLLILPGAGHERWWPRLIWAFAWAWLATYLYGEVTWRSVLWFAVALTYMSALWGVRRLWAGRARRAARS